MADQAYLNLTLSKDEALVLFEFLSRINHANHSGLFEDQAEQRVLWDLECLLEKELVEPFQENYIGLVASARTRLRNEE